MLPMPTEWWLRPVSRACRVGAHSAVVWNRLYRNPPSASRSAVGIRQGPPKVLDAPKPTSSSRMTRTFGAPSGGSSGSIGGNAVSASFASYVVSPWGGRSGMGSMVRAWRSGDAVMGSALHRDVNTPSSAASVVAYSPVMGGWTALRAAGSGDGAGLTRESPELGQVGGRRH